MRQFHLSSLLSLAAVCLASGASAQQVVLDFDDLSGFAPIPAGYGGVADWGSWAATDTPDLTYPAFSAPVKILSVGPQQPIVCGQEIIFESARVVTAMDFSFELYHQGALVHTTAIVTPNTPGPAILLPSGYSGVIDEMRYVSGVNVHGVDDFTFTIPNSFPEGCNGDGGDQMGCSNCPCGNNAPQGTVGGCLNSAGTSTRLNPSGTNSIATADLRLEASGVAPSNSCVLTSGNAIAPAQMANPCFGLDSGIQSVSLDGLRCSVQGVLRHGVRPSDANGDVGVTTNGWGTPNGFFNFSAFTAGATKHFQIIHRDDAALVCQTGQNTSQAVSVTFSS